MQARKQRQEQHRRQEAEKAEAANKEEASKSETKDKERVSTRRLGQRHSGEPASSEPGPQRRRSRTRSPANEQLAEARKEAAEAAAKKTKDELHKAYEEWIARKPFGAADIDDWEKECPMLKKARKEGEDL